MLLLPLLKLVRKTATTLPVTCLASLAPSVPGLKLVGKDYTDNIEATDRTWFYLNTDGSPQSPAVGGANTIPRNSRMLVDSKLIE